MSWGPGVSIRKAIEIARNHFVARPPWNSHANSEPAGLLRIQRDLNVAFPRITGFLHDLQLLSGSQTDVRCVAHVKIHVQVLFALSIDVTRNGWHKTSDVPGTAGNPEPGTPLMLSVRLERIRIEVGFAVQRYTRDQPVVQRALE